MSRKLTYEEVKNYIEIKSTSGCILQTKKDDYKGTKKYIHIKCKCGELFKTTYSDFTNCNKRQCDKCGNRIKWNHSSVKIFVEIESKSGCKFLSTDYKYSKDIYKFKCKCGEIFHTSFDKFKSRNKRRCNKCTKSYKPNKEEIKSFIEVKSNSGCKLISKEFKNGSDKLKILCSCGQVFLTSFEKFKHRNKRKCNYCSRKLKTKRQTKTHEQFLLDVFYEVGNEYKVLSKYKNNHTHVWMQHLICNHVYKVTPKNFLTYKNKKGRRCPVCCESKGEKRITKYLTSNNISFVPQHSFDSLTGINGGLLSYDFYLPQLNLLVEYQGEYHDGTANDQTEEEFLKQQEHDKRKRQYAEYHNINLLEIWYWDFDNIEAILENKFNTYAQVR